MNRFAFLVAGSLLASGAHADWLLSDYTTEAADSATANKVYGIQGFANPSSAINVTVKNGAAILDASRIASEGNEGYSASIGLLHPLDASWSEYDLTGLTGITFQFRNSATITDYLAISFGSDTYSDTIAKAGTVYEVGIKGATNLAASTTFKDASVDILDFALPTWWIAPADFPTLEDVLKKVKNLQFTPKTAYTAAGSQKGTACTKCVTPSMTSQTLEIRNIVLVGGEPPLPPPPQRFSCTGNSLALDPTLDDAMNEAGGYWTILSDFDSTRRSSNDTRGSSAVSLSTTPADQLRNGSVSMTAVLDKTVGGSLHANAGWAILTTGFECESRLDATGLTGISFHIEAPTLDTATTSIDFAVDIAGYPSATQYTVRLPAAYVARTGGETFCIDPSDLGLDSSVQDQLTPDVSRIQHLSWVARIPSDMPNTTANVEFLVSDVTFHGITTPDGWATENLFHSTTTAYCGPPLYYPLATRKPPKSIFAASYANGFLSLKGVQGIKSMDVITLDGRKVASFEPSARVALSLPRGTYFLSGKRDGANLLQSFAVVGR